MTNSVVSGLDYILNTISDEVPSRFFILGMTKVPLPSHLNDEAQKRGSTFKKWSYGGQGTVFLLTNHIDMAQSEEMIVLKLGFARSPSLESLNAGELIRQRIVSPHGVNNEVIHGNVLVACVSQQQPSFCLYQSLTSISQIYYWKGQDDIICSDTQRYLMALIDPLEINPDAIPLHLLYRMIPGEMTYINGMYKVIGGQVALYKDGMWRLDQIERLDDLKPTHQIQTLQPETVSEIDQKTEELVGTYVSQINDLGGNIGILLSGGVDSTLMASWIKSNLPPQEKLVSFSYNIHVPSFEEEVRYAQHAIDLLESQHRFFDIFPEDYPNLLEQSIDILAQPIDNEQDPCYLALAQFFSQIGVNFLFTGSDPDCLFGRGDVKRLHQVNFFKNIPGAKSGLALMGRLLNQFIPNKAYGMRDVAHILQDINDPLSPRHPVTIRGMMTDLETVERCFPPDVIRKSMNYILNEFEKQTTSTNLVERVHFNSFSHGVHDSEVAVVQFFRAHDLEIVTPYIDNDFLKMSLNLSPKIRYYAKGQTKWIVKKLLADRTGSKSVSWPKLSGGFDNELYEWMRAGVLRDYVSSIERPDYMSEVDFRKKIDQPDWMTWNLLTFDLFQKRILKV